MVEITVLEYLQERLAPIPVCMEVPRNEPTKYVMLEKVGGGIQDYILSATISITSIAPSLYEAAELNEMVCTVMDLMPAYADVGACERNGDFYAPDIERNQYRYQAVYDIAY